MLAELEDYSWFPNWMRRQQMEFISFVVFCLGIYKPVWTLLAKWQKQYGFTQWTDCCTGAAGPVHYLAKKGLHISNVWLTDKYPLPPPALPLPTQTKVLAVDVLKDALPGDGLLTFFNAWHHFGHQHQLRILQQIAAAKRPLLVAEITQPTILSLLIITLTTTLGQLALAPLVKPFSWQRLLFTYLLPINIFTITWDGWVSVFRSLSANVFKALCQQATTPQYSLQFLQAGPWWRKIYILTGQPHENINT